MSFNFNAAMQFCPHCATPVEIRELGGAERPWCSTCTIGFYLDPKVAVAVLVEYEDKLILQRRTIDPGKGLWTFPSGFVDRGEPVEIAAIREVEEEIGITVELKRLQGIYSYPDETVILIVYVASPLTGRLESRDENDAVGYFGVDELPDMAFPHDSEIVQTWRSGSYRPVMSPASESLNR